MKNKRLVHRYIKQLERYQNKLKSVDHEYSDKMMYAIHDKIVNLVLWQHTPEYKFAKSAAAKEYVCELITESLYIKLDLSDSRWKRLLNRQYDIHHSHPYKGWVICRNLLRTLNANTSNI